MRHSWQLHLFRPVLEAGGQSLPCISYSYPDLIEALAGSELRTPSWFACIETGVARISSHDPLVWFHSVCAGGRMSEMVTQCPR